MPTFSSPPILIWQPGGGVPVGPISNPPVYSQNDVTQLVEGQAYIDVVFGSIQTDDEWVLATCEVENTTDLEPLNIWPGIITDRTAAGFRLQLNGMPDSGNYYLHWAVTGVNILPSPASTYYLSNVENVFTVRLPPSTTVPAAITITPDDGGAGGSFSPATVTLTTADASASFTYTPVTYGDITVSTTNSSTLIDPAAIILSVAAPTYTLIGPSSGIISVASTNFTVELSGIGSTTVTPSDGGAGGTFTPTTVNLNTVSPSATFTYTPSSYGARTISVTNSGGLTNPTSLTYTSLASTYTFSGPGSGGVGVASTNFTVALPVGGAVIGTVTVTPNDSSGGGTFTPTTVGLTTAAPSVTFTYTPATTGTKTIGVTNSGGLTNPTSVSYVVTLVFQDTFTDTAGTLLSAHTSDSGHTWTVLPTGTGFLVYVTSANTIYINTAGSTTNEFASTYTPASADHSATITVTKGAITGSPEVGIWLRSTADPTNPRGYMGRYADGLGFQFYRVDPGVAYTQIGSNVAGTLADGDTLKFSISGTGATVSLTLYKNGVSVATGSDTSGSRIVTTGRIGIHLYNPGGASTGNYQVDQITSP